MTVADREVITRHFVQVADRTVHYRLAGKGQPVVLIHQSPKSSAELEPFMRQLAPHFSVFAPDTPGYGLSVPLADTKATIDDFVDALIALFDALSLDAPVVFGSHSGAIFGVRLAARYPDRVSGLVANGILINDQATRDELVAHYFPQFPPSRTGEHLAGVWSRIRDQHCYYPWYKQSPEHRIHWPASVEEMHESALEILMAGEHYQTGYRAVLDYDISPDVSALSVPAMLIVAKPDALVHYVPHYPPLPANVSVTITEDYPAIPQETIAFIYERCANVSLPADPVAKNSHPERQFIRAGKTGLYCEFSGDPQATPVLVVHDLFQSVRQCRELISDLSENHFVIAPDLPGHGYTAGEPLSAAETAKTLVTLIETLKTPHIELVFVGRSGYLAGEFARCKPQGVQTDVLFVPDHAGIALGKLHFDDDADVALAKAPDLTPESSGAHFQTAWYYLRDSYLFSPWYRREEACISQGPGELNVPELQIALLDLMAGWKSGNLLLDAVR